MKVEVSLAGRSTRMGAYTQYYVFTKDGEEIRPHRTEYSKTGRHWSDIYYLEPGTYYVYFTDITNSGKHNCGFGVLEITSDGKVELKHHVRIPDEVIRKILKVIEPCECLKPKLEVR